MVPVFMTSDIGGIVYVNKNELCLIHSNGCQHSLKIDTKELMELLESRSKEVWKTKDFQIEPMFLDPGDKALLVVITILFNDMDDDLAVVFRCDLLETLKTVESVEAV